MSCPHDCGHPDVRARRDRDGDVFISADDFALTLLDLAELLREHPGLDPAEAVTRVAQALATAAARIADEDDDDPPPAAGTGRTPGPRWCT